MPVRLFGDQLQFKKKKMRETDNTKREREREREKVKQFSYLKPARRKETDNQYVTT